MSAGLGDKSPPPYLRSVGMAKLCIYLGKRLTWEEVQANQLAGCRNCSNTVPAFHCSCPGLQPFTFLAGGCTSCRRFTTVASVADVADRLESQPPVGHGCDGNLPVALGASVVDHPASSTHDGHAEIAS